MAVGGRVDRSTAAMRAVRSARPPPFDELCALLQQWRCRTGTRGSSSAGGDSVLLHGRPGCGKSTVARALCAELGLEICVVSAAALQLPRRKLEEALRRPGSVLVLEQLELLAPAAAQVGSNGHGTAALLPWLQKARGCASAFVIGCCGQLAAVHPRVRRWFDDECELPPPSSSVHRRLLLSLLRDHGTDADCSMAGSGTGAAAAIEELAAEIEPLCTAQSYVLADVVALVKEAWLLAAMNAVAVPRAGAGSSTCASPTSAHFHAAMVQRGNSGLGGLGGVIDPPAPPLAAAPQAAGPSEPAPDPARAGASTTSSHVVGWDDIGGLDEAKARIEELVVWPYSRAAELRALGVRRPAVGLLLYGPPGTGKTMLARACAHQVKASFVALELSAIVGAHVGESERTLASVFASARRAAPAILFLDELDALFVGRSGESGSKSSASGSTDRLTTTLATELDRNADELASQLIVTPQQQQQHPGASGNLQMEGLRGVFVIAATNNAAKIDSTLRSAGRLEAALSIGYPDRQARQHIAHKLLSFGSLDQMVEDDVTAELLADLTEPSANSMPCSGADIKAIMGQALGTAVAEAEAEDGPGPTARVRVTARHVTEAAARLRTLPT